MSDLALAPSSGKGATTNKAGVWPVRAWYLAVAGLVFLMVLVGGATRLTDSGLSITEWRPITGAIPPLTEQAWQAEMEKYRQIPEYQLVNKGMSLADFKVIYWWEWGHRFLGRIIGLAFFVPLVVFWVQGRLDRRLKVRSLVLFGLGGLQGVIGWYMVASGLVDRVDVSQYRLALHLSMAALIFAALVWSARHVEPAPTLVSPAPAGTTAATVLAGLVFVQIGLGAFVAGLDAGLTYVTWPLMDGALIPSGLFLQTPWYLNLFENVLTVQFNHRLLAYLLLAAAIWHAVVMWRNADLAPAHRKRAALLAMAVLVQALGGIATLLSLVRIELALFHQGLAFAIFAFAVLHADALRRDTPILGNRSL